MTVHFLILNLQKKKKKVLVAVENQENKYEAVNFLIFTSVEEK